MIIERVIHGKKSNNDRDLLRDLANEALTKAEAKAADAETARLKAQRDNEDALRTMTRERDDANSARDAAIATMNEAREIAETLRVRFEDSESARIAAETGLEIERAAHEQTKGILADERAARAKAEARFPITTEPSALEMPNYEIRVSGRDDLGRLLSLKLMKEKP